MQGDVSAIEGGGGLAGGLSFVVRRAAAGTEGAGRYKRGQWTAGEEEKKETKKRFSRQGGGLRTIGECAFPCDRKENWDLIFW